jgi:hypothetical protein
MQVVGNKEYKLTSKEINSSFLLFRVNINSKDIDMSLLCSSTMKKKIVSLHSF